MSPTPTDNLFNLYLEYLGSTEAPIIYHRWSFITVVGALLSGNVSFQHGHFVVDPNLYVMLIGTPGARKSTAVKLANRLLIKAGYKHIAPSKTSKEKFIQDLGERHEPQDTDILEQNIFGDSDVQLEGKNTPCLVCPDEFNNFVGEGNISFLSILGELWDYKGIYENKVKNSKSTKIPNPIITILAGNTPVSFTRCFPPEALDQGFLSRLLLIFSEPTGIRIPFPKPPDAALESELVSRLMHIGIFNANIELSNTAKLLLEKIYISDQGPNDPRFEYYTTRRFTQLLKLCIIHCSMRLSPVIEEQDVVLANTVLVAAERRMPQALGEFGKSKNAELAHKIITILGAATKPITFKELWAILHQDADNPDILSSVISGLIMADKVQSIKDRGFLSKKKIVNLADLTGTLDMSLLHETERL